MEVVDSQEVNITGADTTQWQLQGLEEGSSYRFLLSACTRAGCGPPQAQESSTINQAREYKIGCYGINKNIYFRLPEEWPAQHSPDTAVTM